MRFVARLAQRSTWTHSPSKPIKVSGGQDERPMTIPPEIRPPSPRRHLPLLDDDNRDFWQSGRDGGLRITQCQSCGFLIHPHAPICPRCHAREVAPAAVSGRGVVSTFTINRHPWETGLAVPYVIAIVTLTEQLGLNLMTNVVGCPPEAVCIGMEVSLVFERHDDVWLPLFVPVDLANGDC